MIKSKFLILSALLGTLLCGFLSTVEAGAWARGKGKSYTKLTYINSYANELYINRLPLAGRPPELQLNPEYSDNALYFYGEYGLLDKATVTLSLPVFKRSVSQENDLRGTTTGTFAGDYEAMLNYQFFSGNSIVAAIGAGAKIPVGYEAVTDTLPFANQDDIPPLGNQEIDLDFRLQLGSSFYPIPAYMDGFFGYRVRGGAFIDEYWYKLEAGYTIEEKVLVRLSVDGIKRVEKSTVANASNIFPLDEEKVRVGGGLIFNVNPNVEFDITFLKNVSGANIPKSREFFIGLAFKR